jgi:hypothetical protein
MSVAAAALEIAAGEAFELTLSGLAAALGECDEEADA